MSSLSERDSRSIWHPYTQMQTAALPLPVVRGDGARLILEDGRVLIDAISSWWVTVHGHAHPYIAEAIGRQAQQLEQVIFAGCTHPQAVQLAERIIGKLSSRLTRVFFSDDGSTAVEVALKMAWQYWQNKGEARGKFIALEHAYHGDTFGAMSVSGRSVFTRAFDPLLFEAGFIPSPADVSAADCLQALESALAGDDVAALILEPLVQGAGGMRMYSAEVLDQLVATCRKHGVPVIFDEVMTGFYRTGKLFAADHCLYKPDIVCLSKGLTGGFLPLSLTVCSEEIYEAFLADTGEKMLFHGHSFTANPIGCAAANASLDLFERPDTLQRIERVARQQQAAVERFARHARTQNVRCTGTVLAMNLSSDRPSGYLNTISRQLIEWMNSQGILLRPLGDVIYVMPPYAIETAELERIYDALETALDKV